MRSDIKTEAARLLSEFGYKAESAALRNASMFAQLGDYDRSELWLDIHDVIVAIIHK
ncbi:hypothetical protein AA23498_2523 [Acetobacter nitrogenifigens DSM 23921 = NBRC 105050]|uniref:Uncharacterized protein n=1 Tax=Acetobacter nitrogenifigens DSM 23921 = NBRC 105050 TaxID=1120919 RepID=A0A511X6A6_9PROT|nr:hypothetical protein [Acetobacter nitrogenifigens]GBQ96050.1 hypothetical protein AA23498_2523 [Acetobacter nitrogenifigens DSM 23921 = NBRC 105050]GEN58461.1 hypothetical protein ANI02nite_03450 [Acetobacter nitrogenifigens DSM 23921 = NBRC 105050]